MHVTQFHEETEIKNKTGEKYLEKQKNILKISFMILPFIYGGFYDWTFMIAGVLWAALLLWTILEKQK